MAFKTLSELSTLAAVHLQEEGSYEEMGMGPKDHPTLSRAEMVRLYDKLDQAQNKVDELHSIFKSVEDVSGPAHKLHHIAQKGGFDMSHVDAVQALLDQLSTAIDDMHQDYGTNMQSDTGAMEEPEETEALADGEIPVEPAEEEPTK